MELKDLQQDERLVLAALVKSTVLSDRNVSPAELDWIDALVQAWGEEGYQEASNAARVRLKELGDFAGLFTLVARAEARELIYGVVLDLAQAQAIDGSEAKLLGLLSEAWNIKATFEPEQDE